MGDIFSSNFHKTMYISKGRNTHKPPQNIHDQWSKMNPSMASNGLRQLKSRQAVMTKGGQVGLKNKIDRYLRQVAVGGETQTTNHS